LHDSDIVELELLEFPADESLNLRRDFQVTYLHVEDWSSRPESHRDALISRGCRKLFSPREFAPSAKAGNLPATSGRLALRWAATGNSAESSVPNSRAVTREEVARLIFRLSPPHIRDALSKKRESPSWGIQFMTIFKSEEEPGGNPSRRFAVPTTVAYLPLSEDTARYEPFLAGLAAAVQEQCWCGTRLEIRLPKSGT
jgi:hypothetical protein